MRPEDLVLQSSASANVWHWHDMGHGEWEAFTRDHRLSVDYDDNNDGTWSATWEVWGQWTGLRASGRCVRTQDARNVAIAVVGKLEAFATGAGQ